MAPSRNAARRRGKPHTIFQIGQAYRPERKYSIGQDVKTDIHTGDEIEDMCVAFNSMVATINRQAVEIREQEKQNAMVLYKLLVTQIDPHFIYNTMNVIW